MAAFIETIPHQAGSVIWPARFFHSCVVLADGSILVIGGLQKSSENEKPHDMVRTNDVWLSKDGGLTWIQQTRAASWSPRAGYCCVACPDGSIVLTGGADNRGFDLNDVWISTDKGETWTQQIAAAGWAGRRDHTCEVLPGGEIILMGGTWGSDLNDVWLSTDKGKTWTRQTPAAAWSPRHLHSSAVLLDGSIILMGGHERTPADLFRVKNDVWISVDKGKTWTQQTPAAAWLPRRGHRSTALPDGSIILMGGYARKNGLQNDVWISADKGKTWTQQTANAGWNARWGHTGVVLPDGSIVMTGGETDNFVLFNDIWRSSDKGRTWAQVKKPQLSPLSSRVFHSSVVLPKSSEMPDGGVVVIGGEGGNNPLNSNDVWISTDSGKTWHCQTPAALWRGRVGHTSVVLPDGSIVLMGGMPGNGMYLNDVWISADKGKTWTLQVESPDWSPRAFHSSVVLSDSTILLIGGGGEKGIIFNDVWISTDKGRSWIKQPPSWSLENRYGHSSVALPDDSIVLMGGYYNSIAGGNNVWISKDKGRSWARQTDHAAWAGRYWHSAVALPEDNSILLMGGTASEVLFNDVWISLDKGKTWTQQTPAANWWQKMGHTSVVLPDGNILLLGGTNMYGPPDDGVWISDNKGITWKKP